jgi:hypothetical protein
MHCSTKHIEVTLWPHINPCLASMYLCFDKRHMNNTERQDERIEQQGAEREYTDIYSKSSTSPKACVATNCRRSHVTPDCGRTSLSKFAHAKMQFTSTLKT